MRTFFKLGFVRGLLGQVLGTLLGMGLVTGMRAAFGYSPLWLAEPAWVIGGLLGTVGFMVGVGALTDWAKWAGGLATPMHHGAPAGQPEWTRYFAVDLSHKVIGVQYTVWGIFVLLVGGLLAGLFRVELLQPGMQYFTTDRYNTMISAHGIIMIAAILLGVGGMINYLVPLMIGASDMAFPRLNAFGFWINVPASLLLITAMFVGGWDTGWTAYPPNSLRTALGGPLFFLGFYTIGISSIVGGLNLLVTVFTMRPPSMNLFRMPIFVWAAVYVRHAHYRGANRRQVLQLAGHLVGRQAYLSHADVVCAGCILCVLAGRTYRAACGHYHHRLVFARYLLGGRALSPNILWRIYVSVFRCDVLLVPQGDRPQI